MRPILRDLFGEIKGEDPVHSIGALQHLRMAERANRIGVAGFPVFLHRAEDGSCAAKAGGQA